MFATLVRDNKKEPRRLCWATEEKGKGTELWEGGA